MKNQSLGLEVPYRMGGERRRYLPDFIVQIDDGRDAPLNLIVEVKGQRGQDAKEKANALHAFRVPGVNNLRVFGRWPAAEYTAVFDMEAAFDQLVRGVAAQERPMEGRLA